MLWHTTQQWAGLIADWARSLAIDVTTVDEISSGDESHGTGAARSRLALKAFGWRSVVRDRVAQASRAVVRPAQQTVLWAHSDAAL